jgi:predicted MFS family arabinose efflux permease
MINLSGFAQVADVLKIRNYRLYQIGRLSNLVGTWTYRVGLGWLTWELTESPTWLGVIGFVDMAPSILVSPLAGVLADRMDRDRIMLIFQSLALIQAIAISVLVFPGWATIEWIVFLTLFHGVFSSITLPASHALVPSLVPSDRLTTAFAVNAMTFNLSRFLGPMLAGPPIVAWGTGPAIATNAFGILGFIVLLLMMQVEETEVRSGKHDRRVTQEIADGVRYTAQHPGIGPMMIMVTVVSVICFPLIQLMPGFVAEVFNGGPDALAWMIAAVGIGAMIQSANLAQRASVHGLTKWVVLNLLVAAVVFSSFLLTSHMWVGLILMLIVGFTFVGNRIGAQSLFQHATAGEMRGRVSSLYGMIFQAGPAIGSLAMGAIAEYIGLRITFAGGGTVLFVTWLWALKRQKAVSAALEITRTPTEGTAQQYR